MLELISLNNNVWRWETDLVLSCKLWTIYLKDTALWCLGNLKINIFHHSLSSVALQAIAYYVLASAASPKNVDWKIVKNCYGTCLQRIQMSIQSASISQVSCLVESREWDRKYRATLIGSDQVCDNLQQDTDSTHWSASLEICRKMYLLVQVTFECYQCYGEKVESQYDHKDPHNKYHWNFTVSL